MDAARRGELRSSLEAELQRIDPEHALDCHGRIRWLAARLEEYLDRWLGMCAASDAEMRYLVHSVLFDAVDVGSDLVDERLRSECGDFTYATWQRFRNALKQVAHGGERQQLPRLKEQFTEWYDAVKALP